jgi:hypothetical protein
MHIDKDIVKAIIYVWLIVSTIIVFACINLYIQPAYIQGYADLPMCWAKQNGGTCSFCGITRGLSSSLRGDWSKAISYHKYSIVLLIIIITNSIIYIIHLIKKLKQCIY